MRGVYHLSMATRAVLIEAGPTPWDMEQRLVGNSSLPLTAEAIDAIRHLVDTLGFQIDSVYRPASNEAATQAAQIVAKKFGLRARENRDLNEVALGLWQGLLPEEVHHRFPTVYPKWQEEPLAVNPPDGEPLEAAIERIGGAVNRILRRNRNYSFALILRPMALQIASGILRGQSHPAIAGGLHRRQALETIDIPSPD
jgi:broad specificity phosphatase PhoE